MTVCIAFPDKEITGNNMKISQIVHTTTGTMITTEIRILKDILKHQFQIDLVFWETRGGGLPFPPYCL